MTATTAPRHKTSSRLPSTNTIHLYKDTTRLDALDSLSPPKILEIALRLL